MLQLQLSKEKLILLIIRRNRNWFTFFVSISEAHLAYNYNVLKDYHASSCKKNQSYERLFWGIFKGQFYMDNISYEGIAIINNIGFLGSKIYPDA